MKNNYRFLIILSILLFSLLAISSVSADTLQINGKTYNYNCEYNSSHKLTGSYEIEDSVYWGVVKRSGKYYKHYKDYMMVNIQCTVDNGEYGLQYEGYGSYRPGYAKWFSVGDTYYKDRYIAVNKGDTVSSNTKYVKTVTKNNKFYYYYKNTKQLALSSSKLKTVTSTSKKLMGYTKTYNMPKMKVGQYKTLKLGKVTGTYGNSLAGYYVNIKTTGKHYSFTGKNYIKYNDLYVFKNKPKSFQVRYYLE